MRRSKKNSNNDKSRASSLAGTKTLVVILGAHGGGVANAKWLLKRGAAVTVTDMRSASELSHSLARFTERERRDIRFVLGGQHEEDFRTSDLILLGPGVQKRSSWRKIAFDLGKRVENDASLFFRYAKHPVIAVTGTRGKTTTTQWITQLLARKHHNVKASGNTPENPLLSEVDRSFPSGEPHVVELSSWQLELAPVAGRSPKIAVITNLYRDHLNTYDGMEDYADAKANIFAHQTAKDSLILNYDNRWFSYFAKKPRRSKLYAFSLTRLPRSYDGAYIDRGYLMLRLFGEDRRVVPVRAFLHEYGEHNVSNLLAAVLAVALFDPATRITSSDLRALVGPRMREEIVFRAPRLTVVNDSTATTPDGTIAAIERFSKEGEIFLICGGTDKELSFGELARLVKKRVPPSSLTLLNGSATKKLSAALARIGYKVSAPHEDLDVCVREALTQSKRSRKRAIILFSPGAASFEKFKHEFERGERFETLVRKMQTENERRRGKGKARVNAP